MMLSPDVAARSRYANTMRSSIFDPAPERPGRGFVPEGKRRDQTTSEMFGNYEEKDLRGAPKTFVPKEDYTTARQKKMQSMASEVMPYTASYERAPESVPYGDLQTQRVLPAPVDYETDEVVDTNMRRQMELQSRLFGRSTPATDVQAGNRSSRLRPSDIAWHAHHEQGHRPEMTHDKRAFQEKCSNVFDHHSPQTFDGHLEAERRFKQEEHELNEKRRSDAYYSDLSGRPSAREALQPQYGDRRHKPHGSAEDRLVVHQDWTDSKTELLANRSPRPEHPMLRRSEELHQARIFGPRTHAWEAPTARVESMTHDNSQKLTSARGLAPSEVHQAHLRSSITPDSFYREAEKTQHWEVAELLISGLSPDADDRYVKNLCQGFDLHIVKASAEMDPVRNRCQGRAKVTVRYNPQRESIDGLVHKFESSNLKVEI